MLKVTHVKYLDESQFDEFRGYDSFTLHDGFLIFTWSEKEQVMINSSRVKMTVSTLEEV